MIDSKVEKPTNKPLKFRALACTRELLRRLERVLDGEPVRRGKPGCAADSHRHLPDGIA